MIILIGFRDKKPWYEVNIEEMLLDEDQNWEEGVALSVVVAIS